MMPYQIQTDERNKKEVRYCLIQPVSAGHKPWFRPEHDEILVRAYSDCANHRWTESVGRHLGPSSSAYRNGEQLSLRFWTERWAIRSIYPEVASLEKSLSMKTVRSTITEWTVPPQIYVEVLSPRTSECDPIWRQGLSRGNVSLGWP